MQPFTVTWDEADLRRLRERVRDYRFPVAPENAGWRYGCDPELLRRLCAYWVDGFDVRAAEAKLNRFPQVLHRVENIDIHAVHVVGEAGGQCPLLLTHGHPLRYRARRHHVMAHTVRVPVPKLARAGLPAIWRASSARTSGSRISLSPRVSASASTSGTSRCTLAGLPRVAVAYASQKLDAVRQRGRALQRFDHAQQPRSTYCESAGQLDAIAVDVVERQRRSHPRMRVIGRRDPGCTGADSARMTTSLALLGEGSFAW
jgi:hypothetical protein